MTAGQLISQMQGNDWTPEEAARQLRLPVDAALEAQRYVHANAARVEAEAIEEERAARRMVTRHPPKVVGARPR